MPWVSMMRLPGYRRERLFSVHTLSDRKFVRPPSALKRAFFISSGVFTSLFERATDLIARLKWQLSHRLFIITVRALKHFLFNRSSSMLVSVETGRCQSRAVKPDNPAVCLLPQYFTQCLKADQFPQDLTKYPSGRSGEFSEDIPS